MPTTVHPSVRLAEPADLDPLLPLFRAYQAHYQMLTDASETKTRAFLGEFLRQPEQGFAFLAESDGQLVGFATGFFTVTAIMAERLVHLGDLFVVPSQRRKGIATALMNAVTAEARHHHIRLVRWLSVASNTDLNHWYASLGATSGDFKLFLRPTGA